MQFNHVAALAFVALLASPVKADDPAPNAASQGMAAEAPDDFALLTPVSTEATNSIRGGVALSGTVAQRIVSTLRAALADFLAHKAHGHLGRIVVDQNFNFSYVHPDIHDCQPGPDCEF